MRAEITFNGNATAASRYVGWAAVPAQVRLSDATDATGPVTVRLRNLSTAQGGQASSSRPFRAPLGTISS